MACGQLEAMEDFLRENYDYPGFVMAPNDPAFHHFITDDAGQDQINNNFVATCAKDALLLMKSNFNLTFSQTMKCISSNKITAEKICTEEVIQCGSSRKK